MTLSSATEYFVSYYDCPDHCDKNSAEIKCLERPDNCPNWRLRYRCRLGNMTDEELADFKQSTNIENLHDYRLRSVDELSLEIKENKIEHVLAREDYESLPHRVSGQSEALQMRYFETTAERSMHSRLVLEARYGEPPCVPSFVNSKVASGFYTMEMAIIEGAIRPKLQALKKEGRELYVVVLDEFEVYDKEESELTGEERARLAEIGNETRELKAKLEGKLQELLKLREVVFTQIHKEGLTTQSSTTGTPEQKSKTSQTKKQKTPGSGRKKIYDNRLTVLFEYLEGKVYREHEPLHPAIAYRYTKEDIARMLKEKYPDEFTGKITSVAKMIQTHPAWRKWYYETREKFIGEKRDGLDQKAIRLERFEGVVHDYLMHILAMKDGLHGMEDDLHDMKRGLHDKEYLALADKITATMAAKWAQEHEADYVEIGEIFRWSIKSLAGEFAQTSEWINRKTTLGVTHRVHPRKGN